MKDWWFPKYNTSKGAPVNIGLSTNECPTSLITPESKELIQLFFRSKVLKESGVGASKASDLPIKVADAFVLLHTEEVKVDGAISEYEDLASARQFNGKEGK